MKNFGLLLASFVLCSFFWFSQVFAATVDHFNVELNPSSAQVWEALDMTIEARDKNDAVITDYDGTIIVFSETDKEAEFPNTLEENTYTFKTSDQWMVKFENAVKFKNEGKQSVHVYDLNDDKIMGVAEVDITDSKQTQNVDISILSPETGLTIAENKINVSGTTKKNHRVVIILNNKDEITTTSNSEWVFEKELTNLPDGESVIKAVVMDADNKKVWESSSVNIKVNSSAPKVQSIKIDPRGEVEPETLISVEVVANMGLSEVKAIINDVITKLEETKSGTYVGKITAPKEEGTYMIDIALKNDLGKDTKELGLEKIIVKKVDLNSASGATESGALSPAQVRDPLKITGLKLTKLKTKSVLSWDSVEKANSYNVYRKLEGWNLEFVANVKEPNFTVNIVGDEIKYDDFFIKAVGQDVDGQVYEGDLSDPTQIQTGPELYILLIFIALLLWGAYVFYTRKKA